MAAPVRNYKLLAFIKRSKSISYDDLKWRYKNAINPNAPQNFERELYDLEALGDIVIINNHILPARKKA